MIWQCPWVGHSFEGVTTIGMVPCQFHTYHTQSRQREDTTDTCKCGALTTDLPSWPPPRSPSNTLYFFPRVHRKTCSCLSLSMPSPVSPASSPSSPRDSRSICCFALILMTSKKKKHLPGFHCLLVPRTSDGTVSQRELIDTC